ncbi:YceD family protein [Candidatus Methylocalor cossyra]|uniref:Large ribosomal RNA subunit accumulation protein YceD n=1 Tax=Candidatus Methylocalor cossyra TaxID=3108543 RepID=A0ABM9NG85_9GAMM
MTVKRLYRYHFLIMLDHLPDLLDPFEFADKKRRIRGAYRLLAMDRVRDLLLSPEGDAEVELEFRREGRHAVVAGQITAELTLQCQCCLERLSWPVRTEVRLGIVRSIDEAKRLPDDLEPLLVESEAAVKPMDIVQDELVLAIPIIPQHRSCALPWRGDATERPAHPFAALAQLKKNLS